MLFAILEFKAASATWEDDALDTRNLFPGRVFPYWLPEPCTCPRLHICKIMYLPGYHRGKDFLCPFIEQPHGLLGFLGAGGSPSTGL